MTGSRSDARTSSCAELGVVDRVNLELRAQVVGRAQRELLAVPEGGVVAGMVVDVSNGDVEDDPLEQLAPHVGVGTLAPERLEDVRIGGIPGDLSSRPSIMTR